MLRPACSSYRIDCRDCSSEGLLQGGNQAERWRPHSAIFGNSYVAAREGRRHLANFGAGNRATEFLVVTEEKLALLTDHRARRERVAASNTLVTDGEWHCHQ